MKIEVRPRQSEMITAEIPSAFPNLLVKAMTSKWHLPGVERYPATHITSRPPSCSAKSSPPSSLAPRSHVINISQSIDIYIPSHRWRILMSIASSGSKDLSIYIDSRANGWPIGQLPRNPLVRPHEKTTHPNNMIYLSPKDQWKHWLYPVILTLSFHDLGF